MESQEPSDTPGEDSTENSRPSGSPADSAPSHSRKSWRRKLLFSVVTTALVLLLIEGSLIVVGVKPLFYEDPLVGFASHSRLFEEVEQPDGSIFYETSAAKLRWFNEQSFPKAKKTGTFRIFCLGGSTTVGRPYDHRTSFARWLQEFLNEADSSRKYEVINAGGVSYASYRVAHLMEELVDYEPDLFIVYTGHNEFLERHTYESILEIPESVRNMSSLLSRTRLYSATYRLINSRETESPEDSAQVQQVIPGDVDAILDQSMGPETYHRDDDVRTNVAEHFELSLNRMVHMARHSGAEILLVEPASNLRDCRPFKSENRAGLSPRDFQIWRQSVLDGEQALQNDQWEAALTSFNRALELDDRFAHLHFLRGEALWKLERFTAAGEAFLQAKEEDVCPLRALASLQQIVREVAERNQVPLIPFPSVMKLQAKEGIPGADLFLDHVHPTIASHQILATKILNQLAVHHLVSIDSSWNETQRQQIIERVESTLDRRDHALALRNLAKVLTWAGKFDDADRLALQAVAELPDDPEALFLAGNAAMRKSNHEQAIDYFRNAIELDPAHLKAWNNLGNELFQLGHLGEAAQAFERATSLDPQFAMGFHNLGVIQLESGDLSSAEQYYLKALSIEPNRFDSHTLLGKVYYQQQRYRDAIRHLEAALAIQPNSAITQDDLQHLYQLIRQQ